LAEDVCHELQHLDEIADIGLGDPVVQVGHVNLATGINMLGGLDHHGGRGHNKAGGWGHRVVAVDPDIHWDIVLLATKVNGDSALNANQIQQLTILISCTAHTQIEQQSVKKEKGMNEGKKGFFLTKVGRLGSE